MYFCKAQTESDETVSLSRPMLQGFGSILPVFRFSLCLMETMVYSWGLALAKRIVYGHQIDERLFRMCGVA
jgi:hypothetical protein